MVAVSIDLGEGLVAAIDHEDSARVSAFSWRAYRYGEGLYYVTAYRSGSTIYLHRFILDAPLGSVVDHRDGDTFNNTRSNLRVCSIAQNVAGMRRPTTNTSGYKGVSFVRGRWRAQLQYMKRTVHIGSFDRAEDAARAYDAKARQVWGEFARTNEQLGLVAASS